MGDTIFTKIIRKEIPADVVYEDDEVLAFRDINPQAPIHILIIPKTPIPTLNDVTEQQAPLIGRLHRVAARLAAEFGVAESGYRTLMNCNKEGGQDVFHIHLHLLAGRQMGWPPG